MIEEAKDVDQQQRQQLLASTLSNYYSSQKRRNKALVGLIDVRCICNICRANYRDPNIRTIGSSCLDTITCCLSRVISLKRQRRTTPRKNASPVSCYFFAFSFLLSQPHHFLKDSEEPSFLIGLHDN
jgi:hypothetical protein